MTKRYYRPALSLTRQQLQHSRAAERAAALLLGVPYNGERSIGNRTQVRVIDRPEHHCLCVRESDLDRYGNVPFVLVRKEDNRCTILGWVMGREARKIGRRADNGDMKRMPMWMVEDYLLHPITTLESV